MQFPLYTVDQLKPLVQGFRKRAGLTQAAMAEKLGITQQSYAQMEANLSSTSVERLYTILRLLGVELSFQAPDSPPTSPEKPARPYGKQAFPHQPAMPHVAQQPAEYLIGRPKAKAPGAKSTKVGPQAVKQSDKTKW